METRKLMIEKNEEIEYNAYRLKKLTDLSPGAIFKLSVNSEGKLKFVFISEGIRRMIPSVCPEDLKANPTKILEFIADGQGVYDLFRNSYNRLREVEYEFQVRLDSQTKKWCWIKANPERRTEDEVVWYGIIQEITRKKAHLDILEKMLFYISHVIRRPIANMLGIVNILQSTEISNDEKEELCKVLFDETNTLDTFISALNNEYYNLKHNLKTNWRDD